MARSDFVTWFLACQCHHEEGGGSEGWPNATVARMETLKVSESMQLFPFQKNKHQCFETKYRSPVDMSLLTIRDRCHDNGLFMSRIFIQSMDSCTSRFLYDFPSRDRSATNNVLVMN